VQGGRDLCCPREILTSEVRELTRCLSTLVVTLSEMF